MALRLRRGTDAERQSITPKSGELLYVTDTGLVYVGDGTTQGGSLISGGSGGNLQSDPNPTLSANLNLNGNSIIGNGNIDIDGNITATGNITIGDGVEDNVIVGGTISSSLIPTDDDAFSLGSTDFRWKNGHFTGLFIGGGISADGEITADSLSVDSEITANSLSVTGEIATDSISLNNIIGSDSSIIYESLTQTFDGNFRGSLIADDSSIIIDGDTGSANLNEVISENITLTGSLIGADSTIIIDSNTRESKLLSNVVDDVFYLEAPSIVLNSINGFVTIGGRSPVTGLLHDNSTLLIDRNEDSSSSAIITSHFRDSDFRMSDLKTVKYRGTIGNPKPIQSGDKMLEIIAEAWDGSMLKQGGDIGFIATDTPGSIVTPAKIIIRVGNTAGNGGESFIGNSNGSWETKLLSLTPLSTSPSFPIAGMLAIDDGSNWSGVATNSTDETLVVYLNGNWTKIS